MDSAATIQKVLLERGMSGDDLLAVEQDIPDDALGLLLYGSRARGDHLDSSDFDLLFLVPEPRKSSRKGVASLSFYSRDQLLSASRTLYGTHLLRDGVILWDPSGSLVDALSQLQPADPHALLTRVRQLSIVLDVSPDASASHLGGLVKLARYLLRTAVYATAMAQGKPCFSVRELAQRFEDPELAHLLASDPAILGNPTSEELDELMRRLREFVGILPRNPYGSIESLVVASWDTDRVLAAVAVRTLAASESPFDYSDLPKVVL